MATSSESDNYQICRDSDRLIGSNKYLSWSFLIETVLKGKGVWEVVDPDGEVMVVTPEPISIEDLAKLAFAELAKLQEEATKDPAKGILVDALAKVLGGTQANVLGTNIPSTSKPEAATIEKQKSIKKAITIITKSVHPSLYSFCMEYENDPRGLWLHLRKNSPCSNLLRIIELKHKLGGLKPKDELSIGPYLIQVTNLIVELKTIGERISDRKVIQIVLRNLLESWATFKTSYTLVLGDRVTDKFSEFTSQLRTKNVSKLARVEAAAEEAYAASIERAKLDSKVAYICKTKMHS